MFYDSIYNTWFWLLYLLNTPIFFHFYFLQIIGFTLILSPVYSKFAKIFTSWPIVGGTIACGVFIMLIAAAGIYGAVKHHQIILFFVSFDISSGSSYVLYVLEIIIICRKLYLYCCSLSRSFTSQSWGNIDQT